MLQLFVFLISHLYHFDHFRCLKFWELGRQNNGAFKKIMTFSYLLAVPLIFVRSFIMMYIKYHVGYSFIPGYGYIPVPWQLWPEHYKRLIFPAQMCFALAWSLEFVSHLEELCFWLFLTRVSILHTSWFNSWNCWIWAGGSVAGLIVMPIVAVMTRSDPLVNEAYISLVGSIVSTIITLAFFRVIYIFPDFMDRVKTEGAGQEVVTRLQTFHALNMIRVAFRSIFVLSILILAADGVHPHTHPINQSSSQTTSRTPIIEYKNALWEIEENQAAEAEHYRLPPALRYPPMPSTPGKKMTKRQRRAPMVHPLVLNYSSPIAADSSGLALADLMDVPNDPFAVDASVHIV
ncbi:hypothetical protein FRB98_005806 [Tulasnella sp. 332]|nr:hypothetical protein FRB98_005806 [Tulasnella sp. 332]